MHKIIQASVLALMFSLPAQAATNIDVNDCEFYVEDFSQINSGYRGSYSSDLLTRLKVRSDLDGEVISSGAFYAYSGEYKETIQGEKGPITDTQVRDDEQTFVFANRTINGKFLEIRFPLSWDRFGQSVGKRQVKEFTYYVTVRKGQEDTTYWFKNQARNFSGDDISSNLYYYSDSIYLGGYSSARYLWRDSGSPIFANRAACLNR